MNIYSSYKWGSDRLSFRSCGSAGLFHALTYFISRYWVPLINHMFCCLLYSLSCSSVCMCLILAHTPSSWSMPVRWTSSRMSIYSSMTSQVARFWPGPTFTLVPSGQFWSNFRTLLNFVDCVCLRELCSLQLLVPECSGGQQQSGRSFAAQSQDRSSPANFHNLVPAGEKNICTNDALQLILHVT